jgi:hypothetical protein
MGESSEGKINVLRGMGKVKKKGIKLGGKETYRPKEKERLEKMKRRIV